MVSRRQKNIAIFQVSLCSILWSLAGVFIKLIPWDAMCIAGMRSFFSLWVVIPYFIFTKRKFKINKLSVLQGLCMATLFSLFVSANKLTTSANAIVLQFTDTIFIIIFSYLFFKTIPSKLDVITVLITLCGIALFFFDQLDAGHIIGNIVAILSGVVFALFYIIVGQEKDEDSVMSGMLMGHSFMFLIGLPFVLTKGIAITTPAVISIVTLGVVQLGIPYILLGLGSRYCSTIACALLSAFEPLLNPIWVLIVTGEKPGKFALIGGAIVFVTIVTWTILNEKLNKNKALT